MDCFKELRLVQRKNVIYVTIRVQGNPVNLTKENLLRCSENLAQVETCESDYIQEDANTSLVHFTMKDETKVSVVWKMLQNVKLLDVTVLPIIDSGKKYQHGCCQEIEEINMQYTLLGIRFKNLDYQQVIKQLEEARKYNIHKYHIIQIQEITRKTKRKKRNVLLGKRVKLEETLLECRKQIWDHWSEKLMENKIGTLFFAQKIAANPVFKFNGFSFSVQDIDEDNVSSCRKIWQKFLKFFDYHHFPNDMSWTHFVRYVRKRIKTMQRSIIFVESDDVLNHELRFR